MSRPWRAAYPAAGLSNGEAGEPTRATTPTHSHSEDGYPWAVGDGELMRRVAEGDASAFVVLYQRYRRPMLHYFNRRLGDRWYAEDLVQELFMRVLRAADRYDPNRPFGAWLQGIAANLVLDVHRRRAARPEEIALDALAEREEGVSTGAAKRPMSDPCDLAVARSEVERLRRAVGSLPPVYRQVVAAHVYAERPFGDIAARLGTPEGTARRRMHEAVRRLRRALRTEDAVSPTLPAEDHAKHTRSHDGAA